MFGLGCAKLNRPCARWCFSKVAPAQGCAFKLGTSDASRSMACCGGWYRSVSVKGRPQAWYDYERHGWPGQRNALFDSSPRVSRHSTRVPCDSCSYPSPFLRTTTSHIKMHLNRRCFIAVATSSLAFTSTPVAASVLVAARTRASASSAFFSNRAVSLLATQVSSSSSSSKRQFSTTKMATP